MGNNDDDMLSQSESLDSDEIRNRDGDEVVDPPDEWIRADVDETLDQKLAAELPDDARGNRPPADDPQQIDGTPEDGDSFFNVEA